MKKKQEMNINKKNSNNKVNLENSSNNSIGINYMESILNPGSYEYNILNNIIIRKIQYFIANYFEKKEKKFIEKNNFLLYKISKVSLYLLEIFLTNNPNTVLTNIMKLYDNYIVTKDNIIINFLLENFILEKILIFIRNINSKNIDLINNSCKAFIEIFLFLYANNYILFNNTYEDFQMQSFYVNKGIDHNKKNECKQDYLKIYKCLIYENGNFCEFIRMFIKNQIPNMNFVSILNERISDGNKQILIFLSAMKNLFKNEFQYIFFKDNENFDCLIKEKIKKGKVDNLNISIFNDININDNENNENERSYNILEENLLNLIN